MKPRGKQLGAQLLVSMVGCCCILPAVSQTETASIASSTNVASQNPDGSRAPLRNTGVVHFDLATGRVEGRVCLSNRPLEANDAFTLNAGLNVGRVTDDAGKPVDFDGWYDPGVDGEGRVYTLSHSPSTICVTYVGALPTYPAHDAPDDFKGLIAFNGNSVRATEQAVWLPTPFDKTRKTRFSDTAYDLTMTCTGCRFIYMNGSEAVQKPEAHFTSSIPRAPLFFGGTGEITSTKAVTILNEAVPSEDASTLSKAFQDIETFYGSYMGQPVTDKPVLLRIIALDQAERDRRGSKWGFASWPTIALSGSIAQTGADLRSLPANTQSPIALLSHETAHFYFGTLMQPHGTYAWFLLESTADFLSMKAEEAIEGPTAGQKHVDRWFAELTKDSSSHLALNKITNPDQIGNAYRYDYGPLLLLGLQQRVGESKMRLFMRGLVAVPSTQSWDDLKRIAASAGISGTEWTDWQTRCVEGPVEHCRVHTQR